MNESEDAQAVCTAISESLSTILKEHREMKMKLSKAEDWRTAILGVVKSFPEFKELEWSGDKEGWGFTTEVLKVIHKERNLLREQIIGLKKASERITRKGRR